MESLCGSSAGRLGDIIGVATGQDPQKRFSTFNMVSSFESGKDDQRPGADCGHNGDGSRDKAQVEAIDELIRVHVPHMVGA